MMCPGIALDWMDVIDERGLVELRELVQRGLDSALASSDRAVARIDLEIFVTQPSPVSETGFMPVVGEICAAARAVLGGHPGTQLSSVRVEIQAGPRGRVSVYFVTMP